MKQKIEKRENGSRRVSIDCGKISKTDQSYKKAVDINNIVAKFMKTGILPQKSVGVYGDFTSVPSLEEAYEAINKAADQFYALPASVRKLMDNDPSKMEMWLSDEANYDEALKYGLINAKVQPDQGESDAVNSNSDQGASDASISN